MTAVDHAVYASQPKVAMSDDLPLGEDRRMWSPTASTLNRPHMPPSAHTDSRGLGRSGGHHLDHHFEQLSDLISEAQVGPSSTSMTAHRRTSQIVPSAPEANLPRGDGRYEQTRATESPWDRRAQHGGPPAALLAHVIDQTVEGPLRIARISVDILGPIPLREVGRGLPDQARSPGTPDEARMSVDGRVPVTARRGTSLPATAPQRRGRSRPRRHRCRRGRHPSISTQAWTTGATEGRSSGGSLAEASKASVRPMSGPGSVCRWLTCWHQPVRTGC
jgi:hypothetical protein